MRMTTLPVWLAILLALSGCASLPTDFERPVSSHADRADETSRLADCAVPYLRKHPSRSGFWLLGDGLDAYAARILLADAADRTIDVQYYLYHDDVTGRILTDRLLRAADRGVRVRLLLDDMTTKGLETQLATLDSHPNLAVRIVNPYANRGFRAIETLARFDTVTRRMHNKSFSVDDTMTIVGGRNVGDEYYGVHENVNFGDLDFDLDVAAPAYRAPRPDGIELLFGPREFPDDRPDLDHFTVRITRFLAGTQQLDYVGADAAIKPALH